MFAPRKRPLLVVDDRLLALRLSLNAPVVATAELQPGPARAAIVAYAEGAARRFAIVVRSLPHGVAAVYELEEGAADEQSGWAFALDAALSFGESMGFLFDDELLVDRDPGRVRQALGALRDLLAPTDVDAGGALGFDDAPRAETGAPEILLEDALDRTPEDDENAATGPLAPSLPPPAAPPLSRFRASSADAACAPVPQPEQPASATSAPCVAPPSEAELETTARGTTLGRVRPVRRRSGEAGAPAHPLVRLLADF